MHSLFFTYFFVHSLEPVKGRYSKRALFFFVVRFGDVFLYVDQSIANAIFFNEISRKGKNLTSTRDKTPLFANGFFSPFFDWLISVVPLNHFNWLAKIPNWNIREAIYRGSNRTHSILFEYFFFSLSHKSLGTGILVEVSIKIYVFNRFSIFYECKHEWMIRLFNG